MIVIWIGIALIGVTAFLTIGFTILGFLVKLWELIYD